MRTEMRGRMPRPARIVENRPRKRDQVGIAGTDNGFGLLKVRNEPDSDHGYARCLLHGAREWHLIARTNPDPLVRTHTPPRNTRNASHPPAPNASPNHLTCS